MCFHGWIVERLGVCVFHCRPVMLVSKIKGLNGHPIRLHATIDLKTFIGMGHLEVLPGVYVPEQLTSLSKAAPK